MGKPIENGSTGNILRFLVLNSSGALYSGLTSATAGLVVSTILDAESAPVSYAVSASNLQAIASIGTYSAPASGKAGFGAVNSGLHPALYEFHLADARYSNSTATQLVLSVTGASAVANYEIDLVGYDPQDVPSTDSALADAVASNASFATLFSNVTDILEDTASTGVIVATSGIASGAFSAGAITSAAYAAGAITSAVVADGTIDAATFAASAITSAVLATGALVSGTFAASSITANAIAPSAIVAGAFAPSALSSAALASGTIVSIWNIAMSDISAVPGISSSVLAAINWMYVVARNKIEQTSAVQTIYKDDGTTVLASAAVSDDATTFTRGEFT